MIPLALVLALSASPASAQRLPEIGGLVVWETPAARAPDGVRAVLLASAAVERDRPPAPRGRATKQISAWTRETFAPWLGRHRDAIAELDRAIAPLAGRSPAERVLGAVATAWAREDMVAIIEATPTPRDIADDPELARVFRETLASTMAPMIAQAADAYAYCARIEGVPATLAPTIAACAERSDALAARAAAIEQAEAARRASAPPARGAVTGAPSVPAACLAPAAEGPPEIPAPPEGAPLEIAVIYAGQAQTGAAAERVASAVQATLARDRSLRLVPRADVRRAQALVEARRSSARGPECGIAPELTTLLAADHPNLAIARIEDACRIGSGAQQGGCFLDVVFLRPPDGPRVELPAPVQGRVPDRAEGIAGWLAAARALAPAPQAGVLAMLVPPERPAPSLRIARVPDAVRGLRVPDAIRAREPALRRCFDGPGTARFDITLDVDASGAVTSAEVVADTATLFGAASDVEAIRACVERAVRGAGLACPDAATARVDATICLGP